MRIIHFMHDDKFLDAAIEIFEAVSEAENMYIVGTDTDNGQLKYIKSHLIRVLKYNSIDYNNIINSINSKDIVVVHYLDRQKSAVINSIKTKPIILWLAFGAELYASQYYKSQSVLLKYTLFISAINPKINLRKIRNAAWFLRNTLKPESDQIKQAIKKVNYFATPLPSEGPLFKQFLPGLQGEQVFFQYGSLEYMVGSALNKDHQLGSGIFIGNSNTPTSNHIDAFAFIKNKTYYKGRNIIVPLSYGDDAFYRRSVMLAGKFYFGNQFKPLTEFLDRESFIEQMSRCNVAIFMHVRQQAMVNIVIALWLGLKVFLLKRNPCYAYYKSLGAVLYSIEDSTTTDFNGQLDWKIKLINRKALIDALSEDIIFLKTKDMLTGIVTGYGL